MYATEPMGLINQFFQAIGMEGMVTSWLANIHTALMAVSVTEGWRFTGMYMVIFYAALISLDPSVYEAAKVDGATDFQILLKIKLPLIKDIILLTLTMCLTGALRGFDIPFLLTSGGPIYLRQLKHSCILTICCISRSSDGSCVSGLKKPMSVQPVVRQWESLE